jgi:hypothetical protein
VPSVCLTDFSNLEVYDQKPPANDGERRRGQYETMYCGYEGDAGDQERQNHLLAPRGIWEQSRRLYGLRSFVGVVLRKQGRGYSRQIGSGHGFS